MRKTNQSPEAWLASIPAGFYPRFLYPDGTEENKVPRIGQLCWHGPNGDLFFDAEDAIPKLPLRAHGEAWHTGWDIPTHWAIDADGTCWMDNAHGGCMGVATQQEFLGNFENENERNSARSHLGLAEEEPSWMAAARAAGWTPPKTK